MYIELFILEWIKNHNAESQSRALVSLAKKIDAKFNGLPFVLRTEIKNYIKRELEAQNTAQGLFESLNTFLSSWDQIEQRFEQNGSDARVVPTHLNIETIDVVSEEDEENFDPITSEAELFPERRGNRVIPADQETENASPTAETPKIVLGRNNDSLIQRTQGWINDKRNKKWALFAILLIVLILLAMCAVAVVWLINQGKTVEPIESLQGFPTNVAAPTLETGFAFETPVPESIIVTPMPGQPIDEFALYQTQVAQQNLDQGQEQPQASTEQKVPEQFQNLYEAPSRSEISQLEAQNLLNQNADWVNKIIVLLQIIMTLTILFGFLDRLIQNETADAVVAIGGALAIHYGWDLISNFYLPSHFASKGISDPTLVAILTHDWALWFTIAITAVVIVAALQGRRDLTCLGMYFQLVALIAYARNDFGSLQILFTINPSSTLVNAKLARTYSTLRMNEQLDFTKYFIRLHYLALSCYLLEILKVESIRSIVRGIQYVKVRPNWAAIISVPVYIGVYALLRIFLLKDNPLWLVMLFALFTAFSVGAIINSFVFAKRNTDDDGPNEEEKPKPWRSLMMWDAMLVCTCITVLAVYFFGVL